MRKSSGREPPPGESEYFGARDPAAVLEPEATQETARGVQKPRPLGPLALAALGVVFGDIGTSPLYALKECVNGVHGVSPDPENVLGITSLMFWSLTMVVSVKYLTFVLRADNNGEGGVLALLALVPDRGNGHTTGAKAGRITLLSALILLGASLLYGDGLITPAITVLSSVEGLSVATSALTPFVVPLTCGILLGLFMLQSRGTQRVGFLFGPVMVAWFVTLGVLGLVAIVRHPVVFEALNPLWGIRFLVAHGRQSVWILGAVVLTITGCEALYADMGHFGRFPIRLCWYVLVMPTLVLNYFGQASVILDHPEAALNPFFALVPHGIWTYVLVALATAAAVIASQALISGVFSITHQAVQLGFFPRVTVRHTSRNIEGQIYLPEVNWGLALACCALVIGFRSSSALAEAYGMAVTATMAITSIGFYAVLRRTWGWSKARALPLLLLFLSFDLPFLFSNLIKFFEGAWIPLVVAAGFFIVMVTWKRGRALLAAHFAERAMPMAEFFQILDDPRIRRVEGTCVFMASAATHVPPILVHHLRNNRALHENVILLNVTSTHSPAIRDARRITTASLGKGVWRVVARYGFTEQPNVPDVMAKVCGSDLPFFDPDDITYYIGRETFLASNRGRMSRWQEHLFAFLSRNALSATTYFRIPPDRVVELGMQLDL
jgi:KUP system potassium uptake protein